MKIKFRKVKWEPRDLWIGAFYDYQPGGYVLYVCIVPCFPIIFDIFPRRNQ